MVPEYLDWVLQDSYGQLAANTLLPTTPANRINGNVGSTGPDANIPLGDAFDVTLGGRYSQSNFQRNPLIPEIDSRSVSGHMGFVDHLSTTSSVSLNVSTMHLDYLAAGVVGYDQDDAFVRYELKTRRSGLSLDVGASEVKDAGVTSHDPLLRLTFYRRLTPSWNINLSGSRQFENTGQAFANDLTSVHVVDGQVVPITTGAPGQPVLPGSLSLGQAPFRNDAANLSFSFVRPRTQFDIGGGYTKIVYPFASSGLDFTYTQTNADFMRRLRPTLNFRASAAYVKQSPEGTQPSNRTTTASAGFDWHPGALLGLTLNYTHLDRTSDAGGVSFVENMVYVGITYGPPKPGIQFAPVGQSQSPGQGAGPTP
jgi:hypothetical protein